MAHPIGDRLREARERAGLTQLDATIALRAAGHDGMSVSTLQRWERTGSLPFVDAILAARVYCVSLLELADVES